MRRRTACTSRRLCSRSCSASGARLPVERDSADHEPDRDQLERLGELREHDQADDRGGRREQRHEQGVGRPGRIRAIASWSHTYGTTDEVTPTPSPAPKRDRIGQGTASTGRSPIGVATAAATSIAVASPSIPPRRSSRETRWARVSVEGKEAGVREREREAEHAPRQLNVRQQRDAADRHCQRGSVPERPRPERRQGDHRHELDRRHGREGQARDREIEAAVHHRQRQPHPDDRSPRAAVEARPEPPGMPPRRVDGGPRTRCGARRRRAAPGRARTGARRTRVRGSGRPRFRRSRPSPAPPRYGCGPGSA